jgi:hypothetical protein
LHRKPGPQTYAQDARANAQETAAPGLAATTVVVYGYPRVAVFRWQWSRRWMPEGKLCSDGIRACWRRSPRARLSSRGMPKWQAPRGCHFGRPAARGEKYRTALARSLRREVSHFCVNYNKNYNFIIDNRARVREQKSCQL